MASKANGDKKKQPPSAATNLIGKSARDHDDTREAY